MSPSHLRSSLIAALLVLAHSLSLSGPALTADDRSAATLTPAMGAPVATSRAALLARHGHTEQEWRLSGQARVYDRAGTWDADGRWGVTPRPGSARPYATRLLVRHPTDPARFNGIVLVEWLNTTLGFDLDGGWILTRDELLREGYAWVGVSVQAEALPGLRALGGSRYEALNLPGDAHAWDLYADAAETVRRQAARLLELPAPRPVRLVGLGYSQSAVFLTTWLNVFEPARRLFDGFLLHGAAPAAAPLHGDDSHVYAPRLRADLPVPVMQVQTEMEVAVSWPLSRTPDTHRVRYWEVAGAAHLDADVHAQTHTVAPPAWRAEEPRCLKPLNTLPLRHADAAALHALRRWMTEGVAPAIVPRMARGPIGFLTHDDDGNVVGGLRLPAISEPLAQFGTYGNLTTSWPSVRGLYTCIAGGSTTPLTPKRLQQRHGNRENWLQAVQRSAHQLRDAGLLRPADHAATLETARRTAWPR
jgi:hypothetical protein